MQSASGSGPHIDWDRAFETVGGDRQLLLELIKVFLAERETMMGEIASAIKSVDAKELRRSAHSLKGALIYLGAQQAANLASELETIGKNNELSTARRQFDALRLAVERLTVELQRFTNS
jgi:HPt (histidine-containing phosphotransfer) domain-containing protein